MEPVLLESVKAVLETLPPVETIPPVENLAIASETTIEKCLCEKAKGWLEESIHNPINYHPDEEYDYGSRALRDVGDDERYYEDVKSRCECRKRKHELMARTILLACKLGMKLLPKEVDAAKKRCIEKPNNETSSSSSTPVELAVNPHEEVKATKAEVEADGFTPIENGVPVRQFNANGQMFHEGNVVGVKIDKKSKIMTHFMYN